MVMKGSEQGQGGGGLSFSRQGRGEIHALPTTTPHTVGVEKGGGLLLGLAETLVGFAAGREGERREAGEEREGEEKE